MMTFLLIGGAIVLIALLAHNLLCLRAALKTQRQQTAAQQAGLNTRLSDHARR